MRCLVEFVDSKQETLLYTNCLYRLLKFSLLSKQICSSLRIMMESNAKEVSVSRAMQGSEMHVRFLDVLAAMHVTSIFCFGLGVICF